MLTFIIRRILWTIPVILLVILMTFPMTGRSREPLPQLGTRGSGLDPAQPRPEVPPRQPGTCSTRTTSKGRTVDLGPSLVQRNENVNDVIKEHFPVSLKLGGFARLFAIVVGIPLGILSALKQNTVSDYLSMGFVNIGYALPSFFISTLLLYFFAVKWRDVTGLPTNGWGGWRTWILPAIALGLAPMRLRAHHARCHAPDAAAGLHPHGQGEGTSLGASRQPARLAQLADPDRDGRRAAARLHHHRLVHRRVDFRGPGIGRYSSPR